MRSDSRASFVSGVIATIVALIVHVVLLVVLLVVWKVAHTHSVVSTMERLLQKPAMKPTHAPAIQLDKRRSGNRQSPAPVRLAPLAKQYDAAQIPARLDSGHDQIDSNQLSMPVVTQQPIMPAVVGRPVSPSAKPRPDRSHPYSHAWHRRSPSAQRNDAGTERRMRRPRKTVAQQYAAQLASTEYAAAARPSSALSDTAIASRLNAQFGDERMRQYKRLMGEKMVVMSNAAAIPSVMESFVIVCTMTIARDGRVCAVDCVAEKSTHAQEAIVAALKEVFYALRLNPLPASYHEDTYSFHFTIQVADAPRPGIPMHFVLIDNIF